MKTGKRKFGGKTYDFYMYANNKTKAEQTADWYRKHNKGNARITVGKHPKTNGKRYSIWVRD